MWTITRPCRWYEYIIYSLLADEEEAEEEKISIMKPLCGWHTLPFPRPYVWCAMVGGRWWYIACAYDMIIRMLWMIFTISVNERNVHLSFITSLRNAFTSNTTHSLRLCQFDKMMIFNLANKQRWVLSVMTKIQWNCCCLVLAMAWQAWEWSKYDFHSQWLIRLMCIQLA